MNKTIDIIKTSDWKTEKHVPVIEVLEVKNGLATVKVTVGKEIPHPNTTEHHIRYIELFFLPEGEAFPFNIGRAEFNAHGESTKGANQSGVFTEPIAYFTFKTNKPGKLIAYSYCNIHGLWQGEAELKV